MDPVAAARPILERLNEKAKWIEARLTKGRSSLWLWTLGARRRSLDPGSLVQDLRSAIRGWYSGDVYQALSDAISGNSIITTRSGVNRLRGFCRPAGFDNHPAAVKSCETRGSGIMAKQCTDVERRKRRLRLDPSQYHRWIRDFRSISGRTRIHRMGRNKVIDHVPQGVIIAGCRKGAADEMLQIR